MNISFFYSNFFTCPGGEWNLKLAPYTFQILSAYLPWQAKNIARARKKVDIYDIVISQIYHFQEDKTRSIFVFGTYLLLIFSFLWYDQLYVQL